MAAPATPKDAIHNRPPTAIALRTFIFASFLRSMCLKGNQRLQICQDKTLRISVSRFDTFTQTPAVTPSTLGFTITHQPRYLLAVFHCPAAIDTTDVRPTSIDDGASTFSHFSHTAPFPIRVNLQESCVDVIHRGARGHRMFRDGRRGATRPLKQRPQLVA